MPLTRTYNRRVAYAKGIKRLDDKNTVKPKVVKTTPGPKKDLGTHAIGGTGAAASFVKSEVNSAAKNFSGNKSRGAKMRSVAAGGADKWDAAAKKKQEQRKAYKRSLVSGRSTPAGAKSVLGDPEVKGKERRKEYEKMRRSKNPVQKNIARQLGDTPSAKGEPGGMAQEKVFNQSQRKRAGATPNNLAVRGRTRASYAKYVNKRQKNVRYRAK